MEPPPKRARKPQTAEWRGGAPYADIVSGRVRHYGFRTPNLDPFPASAEAATHALIALIDGVLADVVTYSSGRRVVAEFTVGKTTIAPLPSLPDRSTFDPFNLSHVDISKHAGHRWHQTYRPNGFDGMVVVTVITEAQVPAGCNTSMTSPQNYVLALELLAILHYSYVAKDTRMTNTSFHPGRLESSGSKSAYALYVAFKTRPNPIELEEE